MRALCVLAFIIASEKFPIVWSLFLAECHMSFSLSLIYFSFFKTDIIINLFSSIMTDSWWRLWIHVWLHRWLSRKESAYNVGATGNGGFNPHVWKIPWRRAWQSTLVSLLGESHGQRGLAGYNPWGGKESDTVT